MSQTVGDDILAQVGDLLTGKTGILFPPKRWPDLARGLAAAARDLGCANARECAEQLLAAPLTRERIEILASHLTVGETYFFREKRSLEALERHILPDLIRDRRQNGRELRLWSAGCASGEEAYTLAILLHRLLPDLDNWRIHLLATDINPLALQKAMRGHYGKWAFRDTPPEILEQYFTRRERHWEILPHLKRLVNFAYLNLAQDPYPSLVTRTNALDVILCRNVLMYLSRRHARQVLDQLTRALVEGGWLIISLTETSIPRFSGLTMVNFPEAIVYRKGPRDNGRAAAGAACPVAPPAPDFPRRIISGPGKIRGPEAGPATAATPPPPPPPAPALEAPSAVAAPGPEPQGPEATEAIGFARNCASQGDLIAALNWCEQAVAKDRLNPAWYYLKAAILQEQDALAGAAASLRQAVYLDPDFVMAHFALGILALRQDDQRAAARHFRHALALLQGYQPDAALPEGEGLTAGRLQEIVHSTMSMRKLREGHALAG